MKLLINATLKTWYYESRSTVISHDGKILTANFDDPKIDVMANYLRTTKGIFNDRFLGFTPIVEAVPLGTISDLLNEQTGTELATQTGNITESEVAVRLRGILQFAVTHGSSDIHLEVYEKETRVYARIDGRRVLVGKVIPEHEYGERLFAYIFNSKATEKDTDYIAKDPNNGQMTMTLLDNGERRDTFWRLAYIPAKRGGKCTMRLLNGESSIPKLEEMGWTEGHIKQMRDYLKMPSGICIIAGKTGSGKSTAIASVFSEIHPSRAVHTLEDPPEFELGIMQTQVMPNVKINGEDFFRGFYYYSKLLLRHDIDIELHGETRDHAGAMELMRKGETGQLMFSTLHTSSATGIAHTFSEQMMVPAAVVAAPDLMRLWVYQALVRKLCPHCKFTKEQAIAYHRANGITPEFVEVIEGLPLICDKEEAKGIRFANPEGCSHCTKGEKGRTAVIEMLVLDDEDRHFILNKDYLGWQVALKAKGYKDVRWHAISKIKAGEVDITTASSKVNNILPTSSESVYSSFIAPIPTPQLGLSEVDNDA